MKNSNLSIAYLKLTKKTFYGMIKPIKGAKLWIEK